MKTVTVEGVVFSGQGRASRFVEISWAKDQIEKKLGFKPYLGTLNVRISGREATRLRRILAESKSIEITPQTGFYRALCFNVTIMNRARGAIISPEKPNYPPNVVEIIAPLNLRKALSLRDGDRVEITIMSGEGARV